MLEGMALVRVVCAIFPVKETEEWSVLVFFTIFVVGCPLSVGKVVPALFVVIIVVGRANFCGSLTWYPLMMIIGIRRS